MKAWILILSLLSILTAGLANDATPDEITVETPATAFIRLKDGYHLENDYYIDSQGNEYGRAVLLRDMPPTMTERIKENFWKTLVGSFVTGLIPAIFLYLKKKRDSK